MSKNYEVCKSGPNLNEKWVDNVMVQHLKVFMSQPLFNISFSSSEVVVHHKHLQHISDILFSFPEQHFPSSKSICYREAHSPHGHLASAYPPNGCRRSRHLQSQEYVSYPCMSGTWSLDNCWSAKITQNGRTSHRFVTCGILDSSIESLLSRSLIFCCASSSSYWWWRFDPRVPVLTCNRT